MEEEYWVNRTDNSSRELILATRNPVKMSLYGQAFRTYGWTTVDLQQLGLDADVEETGQTTEANALLKARAAWGPGRTVFADDAGLEIEALSGEPGVQTRRWNGRFGDDVSDEEWLTYLLQRMEGVPLPQRTAKFVTAWAMIGADGQSGVKHVCKPFLIAERPLRSWTEGWPMLAVLIPLPEAEESDFQLVQRELGNWRFFRNL